ncbi:MAG: Mrp/NBP35 family ATP-binding protein [Defluviicoccus sp.]|nr:Mrp/NBP35 family ATP-binding protein [Defluviicoccus sp.]MDE0274897.1 Mrp/NBP35 family ATP-binding protein [Defluviicoccus sp.]
MPQLNEAAIREALKSVRDPDRGADIVSLGMISGLVVKQGNVGFSIEVAPERGAALEPLRKEAERAVAAVPGVLSVTAVLTAHSEKPPPEAPRPAARQSPQQPLMPGVERIVAVASGKGGVGKSTTAVNLALALSAAGRSVGILDADIYGPSLPTMLGITGRPTSPDGKVLDTMSAWGLKAMSIGFLIPADSPTIWRGPMVMGALEQLMRDVAWGALDILIVDMPPGTGDVQLTMAQRVPLAGAVIVSTPQDLALIDARKGLNMFRKVDIPVLGVIENMSYFVCPHCGGRSDVFTHGGARRAAEAMGVDFLGELPLDMSIRAGSDSGKPIVATDPQGMHADAYGAIAEAVWAKVSGGAVKPAPSIVIQ